MFLQVLYYNYNENKPCLRSTITLLLHKCHVVIIKKYIFKLFVILYRSITSIKVEPIVKKTLKIQKTCQY